MGSNPVTPGLSFTTSQNRIDQKVSKQHQTKSREKNVKIWLRLNLSLIAVGGVFKKKLSHFLATEIGWKILDLIEFATPPISEFHFQSFHGALSINSLIKIHHPMWAGMSVVCVCERVCAFVHGCATEMRVGGGIGGDNWKRCLLRKLAKRIEKLSWAGWHQNQSLFWPIQKTHWVFLRHTYQACIHHRKHQKIFFLPANLTDSKRKPWWLQNFDVLSTGRHQP